jgi:hypothetical protein
MVHVFLLEVSNPDQLHPDEAWRESQWFSQQDGVAALRAGRSDVESRGMVEVLEAAARALG